MEIIAQIKGIIVDIALLIKKMSGLGGVRVSPRFLLASPKKQVTVKMNQNLKMKQTLGNFTGMVYL